MGKQITTPLKVIKEIEISHYNNSSFEHSVRPEILSSKINEIIKVVNEQTIIINKLSQQTTEVDQRTAGLVRVGGVLSPPVSNKDSEETSHDKV